MTSACPDQFRTALNLETTSSDAAHTSDGISHTHTCLKLIKANEYEQRSTAATHNFTVVVNRQVDCDYAKV